MAGGPPRPLRQRIRLLLSRQTCADLEPVIRAAAGQVELHCVALEDIADDDAQTVDAAYISRDITGLSTKHELKPTFLACCRVLKRSPELAWVHTHSTGSDRSIYGELHARGVAVSTSSGANADSVAQSALAGLLALSRQFPQLMQAQRERRWAPLVAGPLPPDLRGQTVVLLGWGPIAQKLQPVLSLLGLRVLVVRRSDVPVVCGLETLPFTRLHEALPRADWLLLACPLTTQTRRLIDAEALALLPAGAHLVNVARGEVVVEAALIDALSRGHLAGAFLDVFEHEPLSPHSPLWALPGVIVSPHSAGQAAGNAARTAEIFAGNLRRWLSGEALVNRME